MRGQRMVARLCFILVFAFAQSGFSQTTCSQSRSSDGQEFSLAGYARHLKALREPSLVDGSKNLKNHVYRFLWLRSFHAPIAVRLVVRENGSGFVVFRRTSGKGGYEPGRLVVNRTKQLSSRDVSWFLDLIEEQKFWDLPTTERDPDVITLDGAQWVLEGVKQGKYHVVDRWSPDKGPVRNLGLTLMQLSGFRPYYDEVY